MSDIVTRARVFAEAAHAGQLRKGALQEPYIIHLQEVAALVAQYGGDAETQAAAWLHDTVEDCDTTDADLRAAFGARVVDIVRELTDDKSQPKAARKAQQVASAPHKSADAALVKCCDKISNVRALRLSPPARWDQVRRAAYLEWAQDVVAALPAGADPARPQFAAELAASRAALAP